MAFVKQQFGNPSDAAVGTLPTLYHYWSTADTVATIIASAYFNDLSDNIIAGDVIYVLGSDTAEYVEVTSDTGVTPVTVSSITGSAGDGIAYQGQVTWSGGAATLASTVTGVLATDQVSAIWKGTPTEASDITEAVPTADTITFKASAANTSNDGVVSYIVFRAV